MTGFIAALAIALSSMGIPGLEHYAFEITDPVPCSASVDVPDETPDVPMGPLAGPDTRKISNGF
jgi:hypothetical protein